MLFVWPVCTFSVWDVARGYRSAFERILGADSIRDYHLNRRTVYHRRALEAEPSPNMNAAVLAKQASEGVLAEALYFDADVVFIVSGLNFHPIGTWLLNKVGIHAAVILTESPYDDENQEDWAKIHPTMSVFTNERTSAAKYGWNYLPHSYDPDIHYPHPHDPDDECDVLLLGTGWAERQALLEAMDWTGINLRLQGMWPTVGEDSPLHMFLRPGCVDNIQVPALYAGAKICLNIHRDHSGAESLNPRAYELAACGAFQLSDPRPELAEVFGLSVPTFDGPKDLEGAIRFYLERDEARKNWAKRAMDLVRPCTFDARAVGVIDILRRDITRSRQREVVSAHS
jgi:spore maturation protein CgeB